MSRNPLADQAAQLAIHLGMDTRPLLGAVGTRINGERRLAAAFGTEKEKST